MVLNKEIETLVAYLDSKTRTEYFKDKAVTTNKIINQLNLINLILKDKKKD